jgi:predicted NAD-dependent protein-ADP-ribosyltransferase YbiA (DUF1768 family)
LYQSGTESADRGNLEVKEVRLGERRSLICRAPWEAQKDATVREAVLGKLKQP